MDPSSQSAGAETIPSELMGRVPRRARLQLSGNARLQVGIAMMLMTVGAAVTAWICVDAMHQTQHKAALSAGGRDSTAAITSLEREGRSSTLTVRYDFNVDGQDFTGKSLVPQELDASLTTATSLPILYLPADPTINHPVAWEWSVQWSRLFGPMIFEAGGIFSLLMLHSQRRFVVAGTPAIAAITSCSSGTGRDGCYGVTYEFHTEDGRAIQGRARSGKAPDIGAKLCVLYLPQKPERSLPYGLSSYRVVE